MQMRPHLSLAQGTLLEKVTHSLKASQCIITTTTTISITLTHHLHPHHHHRASPSSPLPSHHHLSTVFITVSTIITTIICGCSNAGIQGICRRQSPAWVSELSGDKSQWGGAASEGDTPQ